MQGLIECDDGVKEVALAARFRQIKFKRNNSIEC